MGGRDPIIESQFVPVALAYAAAHGADTDALRTELGLGEVPLSGTIPLTLSRIARIAARIAEAIDAPHFGLDLAERVPRGIGGVGELTARSAPTVGAALERCARYARIITPHQDIQCPRAPHEIALTYRVPDGDPPFSGRHTNEYAVAVFYRFVRELVDVTPAVRRIWFAHDETDGARARCEEHFATTNIDFDCETDGIAFHGELADRAVKTADPALLRVLEDYARSLMPKDDESPGRVKQVIAELLVDGVPALGVVAKAMGVGERTLQRQLRAEGTTFAELVESVRRSLAEQHVGTSAMSISEIAYVLGYSDGRAFARAFSRWLGATPTEYRARPRAPA